MATPLWILIGLAAVVCGFWILGPYERVGRPALFDASRLDGGVEAYFALQESRFDDIRPDSQKHVVWAGKAEARTEWVVVYLHGFSASALEIQPVPNQVASALGANLVFTRFAGHGRDGRAMAEASASRWMDDTAEALAVARRIGNKILVISTSTGCAMATLALDDPEMSQGIVGNVMVSPNFAVKNPMARVLTLPAARYWLPPLIGGMRGFEPVNAGHRQAWTTFYPTEAVFPMAAVVKAARNATHQKIDVPSLFVYSADDKVVDAAVISEVVEKWGAPVQVFQPKLSAGDDPMVHVIAGDILSPSTTKITIDTILKWTRTL